MPKHGEVVAVILVNEYELNVIYQVGEGNEWYTWAASSDLEIWKTDGQVYEDEPRAVSAALEYLFPELMAYEHLSPTIEDFAVLNASLLGLVDDGVITSVQEARVMFEGLRGSSVSLDRGHAAISSDLAGVGLCLDGMFGPMSPQAVQFKKLEKILIAQQVVIARAMVHDAEILRMFLEAFGS